MPPHAWSTQLDGLNSIDMKYLKQWGVLEYSLYRGNYIWSRNGEEISRVTYLLNLDSLDGNYFELDYRVRKASHEEWKEMKYKVSMVSTECNYGGKRWWFLCPNWRCRRRCRKLYSYDSYFVCNKCTGYWYDSQTWTNQRYRAFKKYFDADEYYEKNVKREYYNGRLTKKFQRYLRMANSVTHEEVMAGLSS